MNLTNVPRIMRFDPSAAYCANLLVFIFVSPFLLFDALISPLRCFALLCSLLCVSFFCAAFIAASQSFKFLRGRLAAAQLVARRGLPNFRWRSVERMRQQRQRDQVPGDASR